MAKYRSNLPQCDGGLYLTDGGLETTLIFHDGIDLPHFAAFHLLRGARGRDALRRYHRPYIEIARRTAAGFILDSPSWRASADWGDKLGYSASALAESNRSGIALMAELRAEFETDDFPMVISGAIGPRGDGYVAGEVMTAGKAEAYHGAQIETFAGTEADMITAFTMTNIDEAIGITRAAQRQRLPVVISFTLETDGRLPTGDGLQEAVETVDAATENGPVYYMINCAHPEHFATTLASGGAWLQRLRGLRANASRRSHAELNDAPDLDAGDPDELGAQYRELRRLFAHFNVLGGCCGTDHRHVESIGCACKLAA